jgi:putative copper resistance protein D
MSPDAALVVLRAVGFALLLQCAGGVAFLVLYGRHLRHSATTVQRLMRFATTAALATLALQAILQPARLTGTYAGLADTAMWAVALGSPPTWVLAIQLAGLVCIAQPWCLPQRSARWLAMLGATAILGAFLLTGHTTESSWRLALALLLLLHLAAIAFWSGALLPLWMVLRDEDNPTQLQVLSAFSRLALWLVPCIAAAGMVLAWILCGGWPDMTASYGQWLLVKVGGYAGLMLLAAVNRLRLVPALGAGQSPISRQLQSTILLEALVIMGVLAATAVMTGNYSP